MSLSLKSITICVLTCGLIVLLGILSDRWTSVIRVSDQPFPQSLPNGTRTKAHLNQSLIGSEFAHLFWFLQISDIHISTFHDPGRKSDLRTFCVETLQAIRPPVVLASGDLADAKAKDHMGSDQFLEEWEAYREILQSSGALNLTTWLDIRGNHDNFNVPGAGSERSYYHQYSVQGPKHLRSYMHTLKVGRDTYSFIAVDACLDPGPRRPFNFIGSVTEDQFALLRSFEAQASTGTKTIWFGHYPTSCIISPEPGLRELMGVSGTAYLCGHLHTLGGTVPQMYTRQHSGILELELGDWKDNRIYRLAAFDHGLFSFVDVEHGKWPVVLVTNPKNPLFLLPHKEPLDLIKSSTHIRILAFSPHGMESVRIKLPAPGGPSWISATHVHGPLWTVPWNTSHPSYAQELHTLEIIGRDLSGNQVEISHPFSLDGTTPEWRLLPRIVLMTNASQVFSGVFMLVVLLSVVPLVAAKVLHCLVKGNKVSRPRFESLLCTRSIVRKLWILSTIPRLWIPLLAYPIYLTIGPWFIGEVIVGHIGAAFAWGTVVDWTILPTSFTYFYGTIQLAGFHFPFIIFLSSLLESKYQDFCGQNHIQRSWRWTHGPIAGILAFHGFFAYYFWLAYGTMALVLGPLRTWSWFMGLWLWWTAAKRLQPNDFQEIQQVWGIPKNQRQSEDLNCFNGVGLNGEQRNRN